MMTSSSLPRATVRVSASGPASTRGSRRGGDGECRPAPAQLDDVTTQRAHGIGFRALTDAFEHRRREGPLVLRIGWFDVPPREFRGAAATHRVDERRVGMTDEVRERLTRRRLLSHEEQRDRWAQQRGGKGELRRLEAHERDETLAAGPVPDLVVVLRVHHEPVEGGVGRRTTVTAPAEPGEPPAGDEPVTKGVGQVDGARVVRVVAALLAGERDVQRVMEVVGPLCVDAAAAVACRGRQQRVVVRALGDHDQIPTICSSHLVDRRGELLHEGEGRVVHDRVDGVEPDAVHVRVTDPELGVLDEEFAHAVARGTVEIERCSPRRVVAVREVRAELAQVVLLGPEMVVDHIEHHRDATPRGSRRRSGEVRRALRRRGARRTAAHRRTPSSACPGTPQSA